MQIQTRTQDEVVQILPQKRQDRFKVYADPNSESRDRKIDFGGLCFTSVSNARPAVAWDHDSKRWHVGWDKRRDDGTFYFEPLSRFSEEMVFDFESLIESDVVKGKGTVRSWVNLLEEVCSDE